jgi:preprotein translocase subunit SecD
MLNFPRWKVIGIWLVLGLGILLSIPSLLPQTAADYLPRWVQAVHVNLGLDLAGGSHLVLEARTEDVAHQRAEAMEDTIRGDARRATPRIELANFSTSGGQLTFTVRDPARVNEMADLARRQSNPSVFGGQREWDIAVAGDRITMVSTPAGLQNAVNSAMDVARDVIDRRINQFGTREPSITRQGANRIQVQVPGLENPEALKRLIGRTARLDFKLVDEQTTHLLSTVTGDVPVPVGSQVLPYTERGGQGAARIAVYRRAMVTGDQIANARADHDENNQPDVQITFDNTGSHRFAQTTQQNVHKRFAIILDNVVISAPSINEPILGGQARISGSFTSESANQLAISLRAGRLPVTLSVIEERTVGADLGADSIHAGILASIVATVAVLIFMVLSYGRFGIYANLAVVINLFVIVGVMALLNITLTLPGIAGFVLTIGTAVDANVLINERIREERRRGRTPVMAVENGYKEASRTIFEANVVHGIAASIMIALGSGPVKGFAIVLVIGIITSVFTAVTFTRMLVAGWIRRTRPTEIYI